VTRVNGKVLPDRVRPRLRGWLHLAAAPVSVLAGVPLVVAAGHHRVPLLVYTATLVLMFTTSACYYRGPWSAAGRRVWRRLDHSTIFLFIAGSYTAYCALALPAALATPLLVVVWVGAGAGVGVQLLWPAAPRWLEVLCYLAVGLVGMVVLPELLRQAGVPTMVLLCAGGVLYALGTVAYTTRRPNPYPETFGYHEVFHACVVTAAGCHYTGLWFALPA